MATVLSTFDASHEECRHRVCIVCYGKGSRTLSETEIQTTQYFLIDGSDIKNSNFPCAAYVKCHIMLLKKYKDPDFLMPIRGIDYEPEDQQLYGQYNSAPVAFAMLLELEDYSIGRL